MTDMVLSFRRPRTGGDGPFWAGAAGKASPNFGKLSPESGKFSGEVAPDWLERLGEHLRALHPVKTAEAVAARCRGQVSVEQARKWLALKAQPSGAALLWLATCYGPGLLVALFGPSPASSEAVPGWLAAAMRAQRVDDLGRRLVALRAELDGEIERWS